MNSKLLITLTLILSAALMTTFVHGQSAKDAPMATVAKVDLPRFMGDWYVIASIPSRFERGAHNAVENYRLDTDGTIATTFTFRDGSFEGKEKRFTPRGFVVDKNSNALWGMRFVWPIKADYRIILLNDDYSLTVVGRQKRDYVWIMARAPSIDEAQYQQAVSFVSAQGYDIAKLQRVPQRWPSHNARPAP